MAAALIIRAAGSVCLAKAPGHGPGVGVYVGFWGWREGGISVSQGLKIGIPRQPLF